MSMTIDYMTTCDGCGLVVRNTIELSSESVAEQYGNLDIWNPGFPDGWVQDANGEVPKLFHSLECYRAWLIKNGMTDEEVKAFDEGVWSA